MFQSTVKYQYAAGIPGEIASDGPLRATTFRLVANPVASPSPAIGFGLGFAYLTATPDVANPEGIGSVPVAVPGAETTDSVFAGILIHPKEHASFGTSDGSLEPTFQLPDGSWGSLVQMGLVYVNVSTADTAGHGFVGNRLAVQIATGKIIAFAGATLPANTIEIPGGTLLTNVGQNVTDVLAKISLTNIPSVPTA